MKKLLVGALAGWLLAQVAGAEELNWLTDLRKAQAIAKQENKLVMMDFSGSDWCTGCIKLRDEVFSRPEFIEYASKNLVAVLVDFPHTKEQDAEQRKTNASLEREYRVEGFPTVIVLNSSGHKLGELLGYQPGGPKAFIDKLEELKKKAS
jgi:thioredoxin-related protein